MRKIIYPLLAAIIVLILVVSQGKATLLVFGILAGTAVYFLPSIIAAVKKKRNSTAICLLNLFLGWTVLGWIGALVWAATVDSSPADLRPTQS